MLINQDNIKDLRPLFCDVVIKIFGSVTEFLDFIENKDFSAITYDCYVDCDGENYIINRETGEYINWYKFGHIGRDINISVLSNRSNISEWLKRFLIEFKGKEAFNMDTDKWRTLHSWLVDVRAASVPDARQGLKEYTISTERIKLLDNILEYMNELDEEEDDET